MARISTYQEDLLPTVDDRVIGSDSDANDVTRNYRIGDIIELAKVTTAPTSSIVLSAFSSVEQSPTGTGEPLQVTFGGSQNDSNDSVMLLSDGTIVFNQTGHYLFTGYANFERQGSSGGVAIILFRSLLNDVQSSITKVVHLVSTDISIPYEVTHHIDIDTEGTTFKWQIMRGESGTNAGGLYPHAINFIDVGGIEGWPDVPSAAVTISKFS